MFFIFILISAVLCFFIYIVSKMKDDKEAIIYGIAIVIGYFILRLMIYLVTLTGTGDLWQNIQDALLTFAEYLTVCCLFILIFVFVYPLLRRR
jgi:hypothetical protein